MVECVDLAKEVEGLGVAAEEDVLAVVDAFAGLPIDKRRRPAAKAAPGFEHQHPRSAASEANSGAQAGEPGADDRRVVSPYDGSSHCFSAITACSGRRRRTRPENTS